jgi:hypothetical protein
MSYKTFREFVVLKEAPAQQMMPTQPSSPQNKAQVVNNLMALQKTPTPSGVNPQKMRNNVMAAINIAKNSNVPNAASAMDAAKAMSTLQQ